MNDRVKNIFLTQLRDKTTTRLQFRQAAGSLAYLLAQEAMQYLSTKTVTFDTPLAPTEGIILERDPILLPILRSGLALVPAFQQFFPSAPISIVGLRRDEKTAEAQLYYQNITPIDKLDTVLVLDPMIATGGTAVATLRILEQMRIAQQQMIFVAVICAPEGLDLVQSGFPDVKVIVAVKDEKLNADKFILQGMGDFGDRYFGTE
jgi:uracil phosphoribosyltransferase